jgi:hypothetical protein
MSKGSPKIILRIPEELIDQIKDCVESANATRKDEPYDVSSWIRAAIAEKIAHTMRSRKQGSGIKHVTLDEKGRLILEE